MKNKTPISYYGGKAKMLKHILPMIPAHTIYVEPYFGGGSVFFAKSKAFLEVINDLNGNVVNFYWVMKLHFEELNAMIEASLFAEDFHKEALKIYKRPRGYSKIKRAWAFWFITNFSFSNKITGGMKFDNGTSGTHAGRSFLNKKLSFSVFETRLKEVQIQNRDALKVIKARNSPDTFLFLDPPYPGSDQGHYKKLNFNIEKLTELLLYLENDFKGKWMLCNYYQPIFETFLKRNPRWNIYSYDMRLSANPRGINRKREVIITNYLVQSKMNF